jgi:hypothetical protein
MKTKSRAGKARTKNGPTKRVGSGEGSAFVRERRYIVIKLKDAALYLSAEEKTALNRICEIVALGREMQHRPKLECVCVESDWPEYGPTWAAIEARMSSPNTGSQGRA